MAGLQLGQVAEPGAGDLENRRGPVFRVATRTPEDERLPLPIEPTDHDPSDVSHLQELGAAGANREPGAREVAS